MDQQQPQGEAPQGEQAANPFDAVREALMAILQGASQGGFPPEAVKALEMSSQAFEKFYSMVAGGNEQSMGNQDSMAMGQNAVPADQPMRKGMMKA